VTTIVDRAATHVSWRFRLLETLVRRDLEARYRGSLLGILLPLAVQLAQLLVFTYLFATIFKVRLAVPGVGNSGLAYGLWLFAGRHSRRTRFFRSASLSSARTA